MLRHIDFSKIKCDKDYNYLSNHTTEHELGVDYAIIYPR
jgi:hypothetical protein